MQKNLVIEDDLAAVATEECRMGFYHEPVQYLHNCPNPEDLKTHFYQSIAVQTLSWMQQENWFQNSEHIHLANLLAFFQKIHHCKTQEQRSSLALYSSILYLKSILIYSIPSKHGF